MAVAKPGDRQLRYTRVIFELRAIAEFQLNLTITKAPAFFRRFVSRRWANTRALY